MKPVVFTKLAQQEVNTAAGWYERQREGLGQQFYNRVQETAEKIQRAPEGFQERYKGVRRAGLDSSLIGASGIEFCPIIVS